jgi:transcriptional regulator with XRE-family HTH domain
VAELWGELTIMAEKLHITQSAYSKYETNQVHVSVEMLLRIAEALEVSPMDIINNSARQINFQNNTQHQFTVTNSIENFYNQSKELFDIAIAAKDQLIAGLQDQVQFIKEQLQQCRQK